MAKRSIRVPLDRKGDGPLRFHGAPCDLCGQPVTTLRGNIVLEPEEGNPFWSVTHRRCARRQDERQARRES